MMGAEGGRRRQDSNIEARFSHLLRYFRLPSTPVYRASTYCFSSVTTSVVANFVSEYIALLPPKCRVRIPEGAFIIHVRQRDHDVRFLSSEIYPHNLIAKPIRRRRTACNTRLPGNIFLLSSPRSSRSHRTSKTWLTKGAILSETCTHDFYDKNRGTSVG